jgi:hypothetical protein
MRLATGAVPFWDIRRGFLGRQLQSAWTEALHGSRNPIAISSARLAGLLSGQFGLLALFGLWWLQTVMKLHGQTLRGFH